MFPPELSSWMNVCAQLDAGVGWGDGLEPKLIKGPDVLLQTVALLRQRIPELFVLLSGPARGYVLVL